MSSVLQNVEKRYGKEVATTVAEEIRREMIATWIPSVDQLELSILSRVKEAATDPKKITEIEDDISFQFRLLKRYLNPKGFQSHDEMMASIRDLCKEPR